MADLSRPRIWLVKDGEDVPTASSPRAFRVAQLGEDLTELGCDVTWFASTFAHGARRTILSAGRFQHSDGYTVDAINTRPYRKSRSLARLLHHRDYNVGLRRAMAMAQPPDLIFCCVPTPSAARVVRRYALRHQIRYILDIRDLWPDTLNNALPSSVRPLGRAMTRAAHRALLAVYRDATALTALNPEFLSWGLRLAHRAAGNSDGHFGLSAWIPTGDATKPEWWGMDCRHGLVVSFLGTSTPQVDLAPIAEAVRRLHGMQVKFLVAGYGNAEPAQFAGLSPEQVLLRPRLSGAELAFALRRTDVMLAPYRPSPDFEKNLSNKVVEALTLEKPVALALERGRLSEIIREHGNGFFYRTGEELAGKLHEILVDASRLDLARAGAKSARRSLSSELDGRHHLATAVRDIAVRQQRSNRLVARQGRLPSQIKVAKDHRDRRRSRRPSKVAECKSLTERRTTAASLIAIQEDD